MCLEQWARKRLWSYAEGERKLLEKGAVVFKKDPKNLVETEMYTNQLYCVWAGGNLSGGRHGEKGPIWDRE